MGPVADQQSDLRPVPEKHPRRRKLAHEPLRFRPAAEQPQVGGRAQPEASERPPGSRLSLLQADGDERPSTGTLPQTRRAACTTASVVVVQGGSASASIPRNEAALSSWAVAAAAWQQQMMSSRAATILMARDSRRRMLKLLMDTELATRRADLHAGAAPSATYTSSHIHIHVLYTKVIIRARVTAVPVPLEI